MKKKSIIIGVIIIIVLIAVVISIYLLTRPETLGNINRSYSEQTNKTSTISFLGEAGEKIKFSFKSNIENGNLNIILYDSNGNEVYKLDRAKELVTYYYLSNSDTYILVAECSNFVGKFNIKVYKIQT